MQFWSNFAKTGIPSNSSGFIWPKFDENKGENSLALSADISYPKVEQFLKEYDCNFWTSFEEMVEKNVEIY